MVWSSSAELVASVSASGLVTGLTPGQATITATADGVSGTATVTVTPAQPASCTDCLEVVPSALLLTGVGAQQQIVAFLVDVSGRRTAVAATFESSNPAVVAVTPAGRVTAAANLGSSQLTARAGALTSAPVLALVAQPAPGALLVSDSQIEGGIVAVDPAAPYKPGWQYRVRLRGPVPAVDQVVLGTGATPVGGRVVSVTNVGDGKTDVVLALLPISGMFAAISVNQQVSLAQAASTAPAATAAAFAVEKLPDGTLRYRARDGHRRLSLSNVRASTPGFAPNAVEFDLGPFSCEAKVEGALSFPLILEAFSFDLSPNLTLDLVFTAGSLQRLVVRGDITPRLSSNPRVNAAVEGSVECKLQLRTLILPIGGPVALIIGGQVPLGVGFALEGKVELAGIGYDAFLQSTVTAAFGLDCSGGCQVVGDLTSDASGFFKPV
ncbi:MAG: Ig-like domain-containing protein, partial [Gemmatimonadota bacterium]